jgi:hypothetical protein
MQIANPFERIRKELARDLLLAILNDYKQACHHGEIRLSLSRGGVDL